MTKTRFSAYNPNIAVQINTHHFICDHSPRTSGINTQKKKILQRTAAHSYIFLFWSLGCCMRKSQLTTSLCCTNSHVMLKDTQLYFLPNSMSKCSELVQQLPNKVANVCNIKYVELHFANQLTSKINLLHN